MAAAMRSVSVHLLHRGGLLVSSAWPLRGRLDAGDVAAAAPARRRSSPPPGRAVRPAIRASHRGLLSNHLREIGSMRPWPICATAFTGPAASSATIQGGGGSALQDVEHLARAVDEQARTAGVPSGDDPPVDRALGGQPEGWRRSSSGRTRRAPGRSGDERRRRAPASRRSTTPSAARRPPSIAYSADPTFEDHVGARTRLVSAAASAAPPRAARSRTSVGWPSPRSVAPMIHLLHEEDPRAGAGPPPAARACGPPRTRSAHRRDGRAAPSARPGVSRQREDVLQVEHRAPPRRSNRETPSRRSPTARGPPASGPAPGSPRPSPRAPRSAAHRPRTRRTRRWRSWSGTHRRRRCRARRRFASAPRRARRPPRASRCHPHPGRSCASFRAAGEPGLHRSSSRQRRSRTGRPRARRPARDRRPRRRRPRSARAGCSTARAGDRERAFLGTPRPLVGRLDRVIR